jgi:hypothetical protein
MVALAIPTVEARLDQQRVHLLGPDAPATLLEGGEFFPEVHAS